MISLGAGVILFLIFRTQFVPGSRARKWAHLIWVAGGIGAIALFFLASNDYANYISRTNALYTTGTPIEAQIIDVSQDTHALIQNNLVPYRITCTWTDPNTKMIRTFISDLIYGDPTIKLQGKKTIRVYVDSNDFTKYAVDLSSVGVQSAY